MAATGQRTLMVYRLQDAGNVALHIAEVEGFDDKDLSTAVTALYEYERKYEYLTDKIARGVYTFVRHDRRSTKAIEVTSSAQDTQELGREATNRLTRKALKHAASGVFALIIGPGAELLAETGAGVAVNYLEPVTPGFRFDMSYLAHYLA